MPRNNPLCRLIDQITSRWNTLPNSDHHTHRLPFRNGAFLFVQSHPRRSFHLASPRRTSLPPRHPFAGDIGLAKSRERHFLFHLRRGIVACGIINNRLRWLLRGLTREREGERIMFIPWARDYFSNERREKKMSQIRISERSHGDAKNSTEITYECYDYVWLCLYILLDIIYYKINWNVCVNLEKK